MTIKDISDDIIEDLTVEMSGDADFDAAILAVKVKGAIREMRMRANYPRKWTEDKVARELEMNYAMLCNVARYDYNQRGAEGQKIHNENGINRTWLERDELWRGLHAYVGTIS